MGTPLIEFRNVTKRFGPRTILDKVNLEIYEGDITTLMGKSGMGKSVLLKHLIGLLKPDEGNILFLGKPISEMTQREWSELRRHISYMFQNNALFDSMTVFENIALPLQQTTNLNKREIEKKVMTRSEQTELTEVAHQYPSELSGGMQKRVALGRALVTDPKIVLFDEPTTGQDPIRKSAILGMIASYKRKFGFTAILVSHDVPDVFFISNRILALHQGKIIFQGTPEELEQFDHPFLDEFISSLEGFQEELTGLYSRRHFKIRYASELNRRHADDRYAVATFSIENFDEMAENMGHRPAQQAIQSLGNYIHRHFTPVGGFSSRMKRNQFSIVLPFTELSEAKQILENFARELNRRGMGQIETEIQKGGRVGICFEFSVSAGLAEGKSNQEIEDIFREAREKQQTIARFECEIGGKDS